MLSTPTQLVRTAAATTNTTLYTNVAGSSTVISTILVTNRSTGPSTFTLSFGAISVFETVSIPANTTIVIDNVRQILTDTQTIQGFASVTSVNFHISGTVVT